ncbi:MAG: FAD-dependent oxidoreductase [Deltaproteobacteria bacterium]|nr:FAD-dependent oxidoreductase [Deltaproteobacteria bacterium]
MAQDHRIAGQHGVSVQTVKDWRTEKAERAAAREATGFDRRKFLVGAGAAAGVMMMPKRARAAGGPSIAIVGGGIAGLSAALQLADAGLAATVYEANTSRVGGRMHSNVGYFNEGQTSEWCGELIDTNHQTIRSLAKRFNLNVVDVKAAEPNGSEDTFLCRAPAMWRFVS